MPNVGTTSFRSFLGGLPFGPCQLCNSDVEWRILFADKSPGGGGLQVFRITRRIDKFLLFLVALTILGSAIGCDWFLESTFELASESRPPKWIVLPPGFTRADVSLTMSYYTWPWGGRAMFTLRDTKGRTLAKIGGKTRGLGPNYLKHPPPGFPPGYPAYEVITANGITEIIEHRKPEPIFYVTDDPAVWKELGAGQK